MLFSHRFLPGPFFAGLGLLCVLFCVWGCCSLPEIIVLNDPLTAEEHNDLGVIYEREGKYDLAVREYEKALKKRPDLLVGRINLGNAYARQGAYEKALLIYENAIAYQSGVVPDLWNNLAWVYYKLGKKTTKAERLCREAIAADPVNQHLYWDTLGLVLGSQGRTREAIEALESAVQTAPEKERRNLIETHVHLAREYCAVGCWDKAEESITAALSYGPPEPLRKELKALLFRIRIRHVP